MLVAGPLCRVSPPSRCLTRQFRQRAGGPGGPRQWAVLARPALFTAGFAGGSLAVAAVTQYETMRQEALRGRAVGWSWDEFARPGPGHKAGEWREMARQWWARLSDGHKLFWPLCGLNCLVWSCWRLPSLLPAMERLFILNPASSRCLPLLLSSFSHFSLLHLSFNMVALHSFLPEVVRLLGPEQSLALYLSSAALSGLAHSLHAVAGRSLAPALGASGAVYCTLALFASYRPQERLAIILLPPEIFPGATFQADTGLAALITFDTVGLLLGPSWTRLGHAAHLGGAACGLAWARWGPAIWAAREPLVTQWHRLRSRR